MMERIIGPSLEGLANSLAKLERSSGGLIKGHLDVPRREHAPPIFEPDDMRLIEFVCHPNEPLKVSDEWRGDVHCLICGEFSDASVD